jgi:ABC-type sulfate/molybdate transport systems ATPase subunit
MNQQRLYRLRADLRLELAIPILLVTHDLAEARLRADRPAVIDAGRVLRVRDKGRLPPGQAVSWVIQGDAITRPDVPPQGDDGWAADASESRHLDEITLATLALRTLPGAARARAEPGASLTVKLVLGQGHVMPLRPR